MKLMLLFYDINVPGQTFHRREIEEKEFKHYVAGTNIYIEPRDWYEVVAVESRPEPNLFSLTVRRVKA
jgi:hypothetical protein